MIEAESGISDYHKLRLRFDTIDALEQAFRESDSIVDRWGLIRQVYLESMPEIAAAHARPGGQIDPYLFDWLKHFTPVEDDAWQSVRGRGLPMYPQFPALNYFLDFADPIRRIALEVDGKDWHDKAKDTKRDQLLQRFGWRVFRVTGSEAHACFPSPAEITARGGSEEESVKGRQQWLFHCVDGVAAAIQHVYYFNEPDKYDGDCLRTLNAHRLADFALVSEDDDS